jgi:hypothetical protein
MSQYCESVSLSVNQASAYIGDMVTFTVTIQPSTQSYPVEIIDSDNYLINVCATDGGTCSVVWNTTGAEAKSYIITARISDQCLSNQVIVAILLPDCESVNLSVDHTSAYIGDMVTFGVTVQPSTQSYPVEIRDYDNNLIDICKTDGGTCSVVWNTTGAEAKSYIIEAKAAGKCLSNPVMVTLVKNPIGIVMAIVVAAVIYMSKTKK